MATVSQGNDCNPRTMLYTEM